MLNLPCCTHVWSEACAALTMDVLAHACRLMQAVPDDLQPLLLECLDTEEPSKRPTANTLARRLRQHSASEQPQVGVAASAVFFG